MKRTIVILGGYGTFGSVIAAHVVKLPDVSVVIAGRNPRKGMAYARRIGATFVECDLHDRFALQRAIAGAFLVIHAAGPFADDVHLVAQACLNAGAHYLDIADTRAHVISITRLHQAAQQRGLFMCSGASTTPAITAAMVEFLIADGLRIHTIQSTIAPGNRNPRGAATVATILNSVGEQVALTENKRSVSRIGWSEGETLALPAPVGRRRVYIMDSPDLALFPTYFDAATVRFKAGLELGVMNRGLALLARLRHYRLLPPLARYAKLVTLLSWGLYTFGSSAGAAAVRVEGHIGGQAVCRQLAIVAERDGPVVPAAPVILLTQRLLAGQLTERGAFPCVGQLRFAELSAFFQAAGMRIIKGDQHGWHTDDQGTSPPRSHS